ncbi:hypothetical protein GPALN_001837 [Globodera pallida]|nr:hypothetical protein GPALN_001837 [Globodera pallida]
MATDLSTNLVGNPFLDADREQGVGRKFPIMSHDNDASSPCLCVLSYATANTSTVCCVLSGSYDGDKSPCVLCTLCMRRQQQWCRRRRKYEFS